MASRNFCFVTSCASFFYAFSFVSDATFDGGSMFEDLSFTTHLSDGSEIELVDDGRNLLVDETNVDEYISKGAK